MPFQDEIIGGLLIGLGSALPLLFEGKVAGVSGYASSSLRPSSQDGRRGLCFVLGLLAAGLLWRSVGTPPSAVAEMSLPLWAWALAGLFVGFGTRLSGGCTSGHGVCGLGRLSPRSLVSVAIFMGVAILTTFVLRTWS